MKSVPLSGKINRESLLAFCCIGGGDTVKAHKAAGRKTDWIIRVLIAALLAAVLIKGLQLLMQVNAKQAELSQLAQEVATAQVYNEALKEKNDNPDLAQQAREKGYVNPNDQVYQFSN